MLLLGWFFLSFMHIYTLITIPWYKYHKNSHNAAGSGGELVVMMVQAVLKIKTVFSIKLFVLCNKQNAASF